MDEIVKQIDPIVYGKFVKDFYSKVEKMYKFELKKKKTRP